MEKFKKKQIYVFTGRINEKVMQEYEKIKIACQYKQQSIKYKAYVHISNFCAGGCSAGSLIYFVNNSLNNTTPQAISLGFAAAILLVSGFYASKTGKNFNNKILSLGFNPLNSMKQFNEQKQQLADNCFERYLEKS